jgi:hypothetical protein
MNTGRGWPSDTGGNDDRASGIVCIDSCNGKVAACARVLINAAAAWAAGAGVGVRGLESPARQTGEVGAFAHVASQVALLHQPQT